MLEPLDFATMNETDVREEFIAPLLRILGYRSGTEHGVIRELPLRYTQLQLGRKKPQTDPELRGKADYICEAGSRVRWVIEAKPPGSELSDDDEEQAWSYAVHPEVRAVYHCLTNGHEFRVYRSSDLPQRSPVYSATYSQLRESLEPLKLLLAPAAVLAMFPEIEAISGIPLGPGLRSVVRVASGAFSYTSVKPITFTKVLGDLVYGISEGVLDRSPSGTLAGSVNLQLPFRKLNEFSNRLEMNRIHYSSDDTTLSTDPDKPTIFRGTRSMTLPPAQEWPSLMGIRVGGPSEPIRVSSIDTAQAYLERRTLKGTFHSQMTYSLFSQEIEVSGPFEMVLA